MDNYLLMGHILRCEVIPKDKVHPEIWVGANKKWKRIPRYRIERMKHDKVRWPSIYFRFVMDCVFIPNSHGRVKKLKKRKIV